MTEAYVLRYSKEALDDLRKIYSYIANELLVPDIAAEQVKRIRKAICSLDLLPARHPLVEWEPWASMEMRQLVIDNFIAYYLINDKQAMVTVVRIFYGGRNVESIVNSTQY